LIPTADINIEKKHLFSFTETKKWNEQAGKLNTDRQIRTARFFIAKYIKLYHSYSTAIKETYAAFTDYVQKLKKQKAKSAQSIINERRFSRIVRLVDENTDRHPKASMLLKIMEQWIRMERNALVFIGQKVSGGYLSDLLRQEGIRSDNIFGGGGKANFEKQKKALQGIAEGKLQILITTSVIEEGVSVPEVDMVLNYSRTQTGVGTKQRDGRTARLKTGNIVNLVINHPLDEVEYWISQSKARRGDKELKKHIRDKKVKKPKQINLFTGEEEK
jgi:ERCC4-related helicase